MDKTKLTVYDHKEHHISTKQIASSTLWVISQLKKNGYEAYVVGGCLRDLLLRRKPKDFDVATNARPEEIRRILPRALIIGRRFRLVHVHSGKDVIEVSTFRSQNFGILDRIKMFYNHKSNIAENTFGSITEDVMRRDFTINAFYYDPHKQTLLDYVGGYEDIKNRLVRSIGDPQRRFHEDPMRMIRVIRFMAKLDLAMEPKLRAALMKCRRHISGLPPARLFDEMQKLFLTGHAYASFIKMLEYELLHFFLPQTSDFLAKTKDAQMKEMCHKIIKNALVSTDNRYTKDQPLTLVFLLSAFLWFPYLNEKRKLSDLTSKTTRKRELDKHRKAMHALFERKGARGMGVPMRFYRRIEKIWALQSTLLRYEHINPRKIMENRNFRIAYDFLSMRAEVEPEVGAAARWWKDYQRKHPFVPTNQRWHRSP